MGQDGFWTLDVGYKVDLLTGFRSYSRECRHQCAKHERMYCAHEARCLGAHVEYHVPYYDAKVRALQ